MLSPHGLGAGPRRWSGGVFSCCPALHASNTIACLPTPLSQQTAYDSSGGCVEQQEVPGAQPAHDHPGVHRGRVLHVRPCSLMSMLERLLSACPMSLTLAAVACAGRAVPATAYKNAIAGYVLLIVAATGVWAVHGPMCARATA